jgi:hypothetical protein
VLIEEAGKKGRFAKEGKFKYFQMEIDTRINAEENVAAQKVLKIYEA